MLMVSKSFSHIQRCGWMLESIIWKENIEIHNKNICKWSFDLKFCNKPYKNIFSYKNYTYWFVHWIGLHIHDIKKEIKQIKNQIEKCQTIKKNKQIYCTFGILSDVVQIHMWHDNKVFYSVSLSDQLANEICVCVCVCDTHFAISNIT